MTTSVFPGAQDTDANLYRVVSTDPVIAPHHNNHTDAIEAIEAALLAGSADLAAKASGTGHQGGLVPDPGATAGTTQYLREDMTWVAPSGGGGGSSLLAVQAYAPGSDGAISTTSTSFGDVDATNVAVGFTAPSSGNVLVRVTGVFQAQNLANNVYFDLREGSSDLGGTSRIQDAPVSGGFVPGSMAFYLTGVSAGAHTYKLGWRTSNAATAAEIWWGPTYGHMILEVWGN